MRMYFLYCSTLIGSNDSDKMGLIGGYISNDLLREAVISRINFLYEFSLTLKILNEVNII